MSGIRGWWQENSEWTQRYYNNVLHLEGEAPIDLTPECAEKILALHLQSPSMIAIFPLQDWLSIDATVRRKDFEAERINVPADPQNNWCYRMHLTLESLKRKRNINAKIKELIEESNRTEAYEQ
jgi:4-alpha-glucanotransferase